MLLFILGVAIRLVGRWLNRRYADWLERPLAIANVSNHHHNPLDPRDPMGAFVYFNFIAKDDDAPSRPGGGGGSGCGCLFLLALVVVLGWIVASAAK